MLKTKYILKKMKKKNQITIPINLPLSDKRWQSVVKAKVKKGGNISRIYRISYYDWQASAM